MKVVRSVDEEIGGAHSRGEDGDPRRPGGDCALRRGPGREDNSPQYPAGGAAEPPGVRLSRGPAPKGTGPPSCAAGACGAIGAAPAPYPAHVRPRLLGLVVRIAATSTISLPGSGAVWRHLGPTQPALRRAGRPLSCLVQRGSVITLIDPSDDPGLTQ